MLGCRPRAGGASASRAGARWVHRRAKVGKSRPTSSCGIGQHAATSFASRRTEGCASPCRGGDRSARPRRSPSASARGSRNSSAEAERERGERERGSTNGEPAGRPQPADQQHALRERAKKELPPRLLELAARHDLSVSRVSVRNQRWRWGSCNRNGHICLNWRLVTMPDWVRDYVMLHELMHLERMDHSPRFWKLVKEACPEYQDARRWLRQVSRA